MPDTSVTEAKPGPLAGIKILDLTTVVLGPLATQILGDLGAEVIKIEAPDGDIMRYAEPARHREMGHVFLNLNRNKRSLVLDLKQPDAAPVLLALVRQSDVLMHNMRPQAMARLGFGWERLREVNPRLVYCSAHGYGQDGPFADRPAFDDIIQGGCGLVALEAATGGEARFVPTLIGDKTVGLTMVYAVMAALLQRERTGEGQAVEVPMLETMTAFVMAEHMGGLTFDPPIGAPGYSRMLAPGPPAAPHGGRAYLHSALHRSALAGFLPDCRPARTRRRSAPRRRANPQPSRRRALCADRRMRARRVDRVLARKAQIGRHPVRTGQPARRIAGRRAPRRSRYVPVGPSIPPKEASGSSGRRCGSARRTARCAIRRRDWASIRARSCARPGFADDKIADLLARKVAIDAGEM